MTPVDGLTADTFGPLVLQWSHPNSSLFAFEIQVSGDDRFDTNPATASSFVWDNLIDGTATSPLNSWKTPDLQASTRYFWRVRPAVQGDGLAAGWSATWNFTTPAVNSVSSAATALEAAMVDLVNQHRATAGLPAVVINPALTIAARLHSQDMVARNYFAHNTPEGLNPFDRMRAQGLILGFAGENIAFNGTIQKAHTALLNSPSHLANIMKVQYGRVGIGIAPMPNGSVMVTQNFTD